MALAEPTLNLRLAETVHVHIVVDGQAICGNRFGEADLHAPDVSLKIWAERSQCGKCVDILRRRIGHANRTRSQS